MTPIDRDQRKDDRKATIRVNRKRIADAARASREAFWLLCLLHPRAPPKVGGNITFVRTRRNILVIPDQLSWFSCFLQSTSVPVYLSLGALYSATGD